MRQENVAKEILGFEPFEWIKLSATLGLIGFGLAVLSVVADVEDPSPWLAPVVQKTRLLFAELPLSPLWFAVAFSGGAMVTYYLAELKPKVALLYALGGSTVLVAMGLLMPNEKHTVALTLDPTIAGGVLTIEGTTDLPDGALILYEVVGAIDRDSLNVGDVGVFEIDFGATAVTDGRYIQDVDISDCSRGEISVWVAFQTQLVEGRAVAFHPSEKQPTPDKQPAWVIEQFGEYGEKLTGQNVTKAKGLRRVEVTETFRRGERQPKRFTPGQDIELPDRP